MIRMTFFHRVKKFSSSAFGLVILLGVGLFEFGLFVWGAVAIWPTGFFDTPFAYVTLGMLLRVAGSVLVVVIGAVVVGFGLILLVLRASNDASRD